MDEIKRLKDEATDKLKAVGLAYARYYASLYFDDQGYLRSIDDFDSFRRLTKAIAMYNEAYKVYISKLKEEPWSNSTTTNEMQ